MTSVAPSPVAPSVPPRIRDQRVAAAFEAVRGDRFPVVDTAWGELSRPALVRLIEDLQVADGMRVLVVEPVSGYLPELLGRLAATVTVCSADAGRASQLRRQLADVGAANVVVVEAVADTETFDRLISLCPSGDELPSELLAHLAERGAAVWAVDAASPPIRLRRLMRLGDSATLTEDLDLTTLNPLLGDLLVEAGVALRQEVSEAARESGGSGRRLGEELLVRGSVREVDLYRVLAEQHGVPFVRAADVLPRIDAALLRELPRRFLDFHMFLPIAREGGRIHVATPDVSLAVDEISSMFDDAPIAVELLSPTDLQRVWVAVELGLLDQRLGLPAARAADRAEERPLATPVTADGRLRELLSAAIEQGASAVHVEGGRASARVRLRVDGELVEVADCGIAAIEIAGLTAAARELDGRTCEVAGRRIAVSACACEHVATPALTLRVRDVDQEALLLDQIGHSDEFVAGVRGALQARRGLLLIGGPARSGRSTTLRAAHAELLQDVGRKVVWIDDAQGRTGEHDLIAALRAAGQQEADVVCLDAGADEELLRAALASARAGMLVLMTTDGNDAADVLQGLIGRGVDVRTLAADVVGVTVQHLARRICHGCRRPLDASEADIAATFPHGVPEGFFGFDGVGCEHCHGRGVRGLVPLAEFLPMGPAVRRALRRDVAPHDLGPIARQNGLVSLLDSALVRATAGEVRLAEIRRVLTEEQRELTGNYGPLPGICS